MVGIFAQPAKIIAQAIFQRQPVAHRTPAVVRDERGMGRFFKDHGFTLRPVMHPELNNFGSGTRFIQSGQLQPQEWLCECGQRLA